ncbi:unnamed protein product [Lupinus luteus]|uniref:WRKY domain-containing protein n=1 Tax=Lupinus luteus TaxID=3873 RepID=A0AAV1WVK9_LUPLU
MDELACLMDWDLEAIVRGCSNESQGANTIMEEPCLNFSHFCSQQNEILWNFPEFSETTKVLDELEHLYKPFYPVLHPLSTLTNSSHNPKEPQEFKVLKASEKVITLQDHSLVPAVSKSKKRNKNKVMKQVVADGICDSWAWRKYGQKPIKGSPYPRSYYKCSTSKVCLAKKQVERNHLNPQLFLVTYTSEHSHPHPTRRNSLAGSTRKNNNSIVEPTSSTFDLKSTSSSSSSLVILSPKTPFDEVEMVKSVEQSKGLKKEEDFVELLDEAELGYSWFSNTSFEELIGDLKSNLS